MKILHSPSSMTTWSRRLRREGVVVGLVPTMGALHEGHRALIREARLNCDALVVSIFALSLTAVEAVSKLNIFFWFGLGFGIPLLLLSFLSGAAQRWITRQFAIRARLINVVSGLLLLGVGIYDFRVNWWLLQIYLS